MRTSTKTVSVHQIDSMVKEIVDLYVSETAWQDGFDSHPYKKVKGLTKEEKQLIKNNILVYFRSSRLSGGNHGTYWRVAKWWASGKMFYPRVPSLEEITELEK